MQRRAPLEGAHELDVLLRLSGQESRVKDQHFALWDVVLAWNVELRYDAIGTVPGAAAETMIAAAEGLRAVL